MLSSSVLYVFDRSEINYCCFHYQFPMLIQVAYVVGILVFVIGVSCFIFYALDDRAFFDHPLFAILFWFSFLC